MHLAGKATIFTLHNSCPYTIWPVTLSAANSSAAIGFSDLPSNSTTSRPAPSGWSGCIWARTGCLLTSSTRTTCTTGDLPPFTFAEFALGQDKDSYDVSLVQGYNVGIGVTPYVGRGCKYAGCTGDMNSKCPAELRVEGPDGDTVACKTACQAFGAEEYCCTGKHSTRETCGHTRYSQMFKEVCPGAYSYLYDDEANTLTCDAGTDYLVTFCPSAT